MGTSLLLPTLIERQREERQVRRLIRKRFKKELASKTKRPHENRSDSYMTFMLDIMFASFYLQQTCADTNTNMKSPSAPWHAVKKGTELIMCDGECMMCVLSRRLTVLEGHTDTHTHIMKNESVSCSGGFKGKCVCACILLNWKKCNIFNCQFTVTQGPQIKMWGFTYLLRKTSSVTPPGWIYVAIK